MLHQHHFHTGTGPVLLVHTSNPCEQLWYWCSSQICWCIRSKMNTLCGVESVVTVERRSTWAGKPSAAGAVNYLASVGTMDPLQYNCTESPMPPHRHTLRLGGPLLYSSADRPITCPPDGTCPPHDPPPSNAQPLQPSCKPLTTSYSSLPTTHVIPSDPQTSPLTLSSIDHLSNSHPRVPWTGLRKQQLPPGGSPVGHLDLNLGFAPSALYSANTGD